MEKQNLTIKESYAFIHKVLKEWGKNSKVKYEPAKTNHAIRDIAVTSLGEKYNCSAELKASIYENIQALLEEDPTGAGILCTRFIEGRTILQTARRFNLSPDQVNRHQRKAIERLAEIFSSRQQLSHESLIKGLVNQIPARDCAAVLGFQEYSSRVLRYFFEENSPQKICIAGVGGIGKSTLANIIVRDLVAKISLDGLCWIDMGDVLGDAAEAVLTALRRKFFEHDLPLWNVSREMVKLFSEGQYLIVIDGLNTQLEDPKMMNLIELIGGNSTLVLTSRVIPNFAGGLYTCYIHEMNWENSKKLCEDQLNMLGLEDYTVQLLGELGGIYDVVGGNPRALKIVIGLLRYFPLSLILDDFFRPRMMDITQFYAAVYKPVWQSLGDESKHVLKFMSSLDAEDTTIEVIYNNLNLEKNVLYASIQALVGHTLLEPCGSYQERRYRIHRLTRSYLFSEFGKPKERSAG